jgi:hypothetical protein
VRLSAVDVCLYGCNNGTKEVKLGTGRRGHFTYGKFPKILPLARIRKVSKNTKLA